jgi:hypothetical protein
MRAAASWVCPDTPEQQYIGVQSQGRIVGDELGAPPDWVQNDRDCRGSILEYDGSILKSEWPKSSIWVQ